MSQDETVINDTELIKKLIDEKNTEDDIIKLMCYRTNDQRQKIKVAYLQQYGEELSKALEKKLSGNFEDCIVALLDSPIEYDAKQINKAIKGIGTDIDSLTEILGTRPPEKLEQIKKKYQELFRKDLIEDVIDDTSGTYQQLCRVLLEGKRSDNPYPNEKYCLKIVQELYEPGEGGKDKDKDIFIKHFGQRSIAELIMIKKLYQAKYNTSLSNAIDKIFSGDSKGLLETLLSAILNPPAYFARRVNKSVKGLGTNDNLLIRILVTRDEVDMPEIKKWYKKLFKKDMLQDIKDDTSGDYRNLLIELASH